MTAPLLTIAIPTFNRRDYLERLLRVLDAMTRDEIGRVELLISDNASADGTSDVVDAFVQRRSDARAIRNATNIGADANIEQCFRLAQGEHVWILGDDDLPKTGAINGLLRLLADESPDMVYLPSEWRSGEFGPDDGAPSEPQAYTVMNRLAFARHVNVWLTFLSGIVVRKSHAAAEDFAALDGTKLIQFGWVLPALRDGNVFCAFRDKPVLATAANTGGYSVVEVFGANLSMLVARVFGRGSAVHRAIAGRTVLSYLPQLIWNVRTGAGGGFSAELPWPALERELGRFPAFWTVVVPVGRAPLPIARGALLASRALGKIGRAIRP